MALLLNFKKSLINLLKIKQEVLHGRVTRTIPSLLWFNERLTRPKSFKDREQRFLEKDQVPPNYELIYKTPMESYILWPMHVSTVTSCIIGSFAIYQFASGQPMVAPIETALTLQNEDIYYFAAGFLAINAILRLIISMFALRIYKYQDKYIAVYYPQLPYSVSHNRFEKGQVKAVYYTFSPWNNITYTLGGKTSLLIETYFKTPFDFYEMQS